MPKLGLGSTLLAPVRLTPEINLYSDGLTLGGTFASRQWFTSGANTGPSNSIAYGNGEVRILSGASGRHCLCHFDCMKDQYPTYSASKTYSVGDIVYGGFAGHGLYQKTASSSPGFSPIYTSATNAQDANGWTRYRPTPRQIAEGRTLSISLKLKLNKTGFIITSNNAIRIGLFDSVGSYINYDNHNLSNVVFEGYSGYMFGYGPVDNRLLKRTETANPPLISTTNGVYTPLSTFPAVGFGGRNEYDVSIKLKRIGSSLEITSHIYGSGYSSRFTYIDATPFTSFDTLVFYTVSNNVASMAVSNPIATYDGESVALQSGGCSDLDARVWMYGVNEFWSFGPRTLTRVADRHYTFGDEVVKHNGTAWEYYYERPDTGKVLIETAGGNEAWPWLVPWVDFTAQKLCLPPVYPPYDGGATIYTIGDRVSHQGGNYVCIYNAGSVGYGPFGGYLDGTANGIIYWVLEGAPPPTSGIPVSSASVVMNLTRYGSSSTTTLVKKSTEGEYLGNSSGSGDTFYLRSGFVYKKVNIFSGIDYGEIYLLPPNSIISGSPTSDDYVSPSPFWRIIEWTSLDGTSGTWFGYNSSTSTTNIPTTGWTPNPAEDPNGVTAVSITAE